MDKVEMSLDDIIKQTKGSGRRGRGGGARRGGGASRVNARGGVTPLRNRRGGRFSTPRTPFSRESRVCRPKPHIFRIIVPYTKMAQFFYSMAQAYLNKVTMNTLLVKKLT